MAICYKCYQCVKFELNLGATTAQDSEEAMAIDWYNSAVMTCRIVKLECPSRTTSSRNLGTVK